MEKYNFVVLTEVSKEYNAFHTSERGVPTIC